MVEDSNSCKSHLIRKCFDIATKYAKRSTHYKARVGSVLVSRQLDFFYSQGYNQEKSHPIQKEFNIKYRGFKSDDCHHYLHAEIKCLLPWLQRDHVMDDRALFISRVDKRSKTKMARPCPACMAAIKKVGIKDIYYTTDSGYCHEVIY